jgi:MOSC domain-containing protein
MIRCFGSFRRLVVPELPKPMLQLAQHLLHSRNTDNIGRWPDVLVDFVMRDLGRVMGLQIQRSTLKTGEKPRRVYDPSPILPVDRIAVTPDGVMGEAPDRSWIVDVHHRGHPDTKNPDGEHGVSVGFTSHYAAMQDRFGERIRIGCAGENIIVEADGRVTLDDLRAGLALCSAGGAERVRLTVLDVAHPCRPFTGWALGGTVEAEVLKEHLQFLDGGTRGFYCLGVGNGIVSVGDRVVLL